MSGDYEEHTVVGDRRELIEQLKQRKALSSQRAYLIVIAGPDAGEMFQLGNGGVIGRGDQAVIRLSDTECSRQHATFIVDLDGIRVEDLESTNGTFVNGEPIHARTLSDGDKIQVGTTTILKFSYQDAVEEKFQRRMYESAIRDGLTGAFNKRHFDDRIGNEVAFSRRHGTPFSLLLLDLDHFKRLNDQYGHLAGDAALSQFGELIGAAIRSEDVFCRYGGEEFGILSRGIGRQEALQFAERLRGITEEHSFTYEGKRLPVTVSIGLADMPRPGIEQAKDLIEAADKQLYEAKAAGRNRVA